MSDSVTVSPETAKTLAQALAKAGFTSAGIAEHLGPAATQAMFRGEPGVVRHACQDGSRLSRLIRFFILREPCTAAELSDVLSQELVQLLIDDCVVAPATDNAELHIALDVRPHVIADEERFVFSDLDASMTDIVPGHDHVLGVGAASLSLLSAAPQTPVSSVLDLGTGSGVQALAQAHVAKRVVATDVHGRALDLARATFAANGVDNVELRQGSWFEPVAGERFDRIVANPPFVVGLPEVGHVYRDSGLDLDAASELVVSGAVEHLAEGGRAFILGSWVHSKDASWQSRVASWLPSTGVNAWVLQRDVVDPGMYVSTWLRDESIDPRSAEGIERTERWLEHFAQNNVTGIGFGWIVLEDIGDAATEVTAEELSQHFTDRLAPEVEEYFLRSDWLRGKSFAEVLDAQYMLRPGVALEEVSLADTETGIGFAPEVIRVTRTDGPRFTHTVDAGVLSVIRGLHPQGLALRDVTGLYAAANGINDEAALHELEQSSSAAIVDLVRHGVVLPAEIAAI